MNTYATAGELREHEAELARDRGAWQHLLTASTLTPYARLLGLVIAASTDESGQQGVWLSYGDLARATGLTADQVRYYLDQLDHFGWIHRPTGPGGAWYLRWPE